MTRFVVGADHPSLPGHFPGRPVVPGVVLLDCAFALIARDQPTLPPIEGIETVKFLAPVMPGETIDVEWREAAPGRLDFTCVVAGQTVLRGRALLGRALLAGAP